MDFSLSDFGSIAAIASLFFLFYDRLEKHISDARISKLHVYDRGDFLAISVAVEAGTKVAHITSIHANGAKIACQASTYSAYQLHFVSAPDDSAFVSELELGWHLKPFCSSSEHVFVVKPKPSDKLKISFKVESCFFSISRKAQ